jgi:hypothetical protein
MEMPAPIGGVIEGIQAEEVPAERWQELFGEHEPFKSLGFPPANNNKVVALIDHSTGRVRAYWWLCSAVHFEPLWIAPEDRKNPGVIRRLWRGVVKVAKQCGIVSAFALIDHNNPQADEVHTAALRLGFHRAGADLYYVMLDDAKEV